jgi:hypothetical protein
MRFTVPVLACVTAGAISLALADPSTPAQQQPAAAPSSSAPAAAPATAAATPPAKPAVDPDEKRLIAMGYRPEMRNGERVFCRREEVLGSRLSVKKLCGTPKDLQAAQTAYREELEGQQHVQINPDPMGTKGH